MAHGDAREGKWRWNWRMEWVASTLHTTSNMVYTALLPLMRTPRLPVVDWTDDWTLPFRRKTKSGFCVCAITFQLASSLYVRFVSSYILSSIISTVDRASVWNASDGMWEYSVLRSWFSYDIKQHVGSAKYVFGFPSDNKSEVNVACLFFFFYYRTRQTWQIWVLFWQTSRCTHCATGNYLAVFGNLRYRNVSVKSLISSLYFR